jgi:EpsI family protein
MAMNRTVAFMTASILLLGIILYHYYLSEGENVQLVQPLRLFPLIVGSWRGSPEENTTEIYSDEGLQDSILRFYQDRNGDRIWVFMGYSENQYRGKRISTPKLTPFYRSWNLIFNETVVIPLEQSGSQGVTAHQLIVQRGGMKRLILYWYQIDEQIISNDTFYRLNIVKNLLLTKRSHGLMICLISPLLNERDSGKKLDDQIQFIKEFLPVLTDFIRAGRHETKGVAHAFD